MIQSFQLFSHWLNLLLSLTFHQTVSIPYLWGTHINIRPYSTNDLSYHKDSDFQLSDAALLHVYSFDISDARSNFAAYIIKASCYVITIQPSLSLSIQASSNALTFLWVS